MTDSRAEVAASWLLVLVPFQAACLYQVGTRLPVSMPGAGVFVAACVLGALLACVSAYTLRARVLAIGACLLLLAVFGGLWTAASVGLAAALAAWGSGWLCARLPALALAPALKALWVGGMLITLVQTGRLGAYLGDPGSTWGAVVPNEEMVVRHSCLTSYVHACTLVERGQDPYDPVYDPEDLDLDAPLPATAAEVAPFTLDMFGYTPVYLVLIRALRVIAPDFLALRALFPFWSLLAWSGVLWSTARHLGGATERRILWLAPLTLSTVPMYISLQFGNASILLAAVCVGAWLAMQRGRGGTAGALIAFATLTRYMPALLALIVTLRRRWRVVLGGMVGTVVMVAAPLLVFGPTPWSFFVHTLLPNMASSQVMRFLDDGPRQIAINSAPFSLPFKLSALGVGEAGWAVAKRVNQGFTLLLLGLTVWTALVPATDRHDLLRWASIAMLGSVATSFAGPHVHVSTVFVLLLLAGELRGWRAWCGYAALWMILVVFPLPMPTTALLLGGLLQTLVLVGLFTWLIVRSPRPDVGSGRAVPLRGATG